MFYTVRCKITSFGKHLDNSLTGNITKDCKVIKLNPTILQELTSFNLSGKNYRCVFLAEYDKYQALFCIFTLYDNCVEDMMNAYFKEVEIEVDDIFIRECTIKEYTKFAKRAYNCCIVQDISEVYENSKIEDFADEKDYSQFIEEYMVDEHITKKKVMSKASKTLWEDTLVPEIERIYTPAKIELKRYCHPVHYLVMGEVEEKTKEVAYMITDALYQNQRVKSKRVCMITLSNRISSIRYKLNDLYMSSKYGTVIIMYDGRANDEPEYDKGNMRSHISIISDYVRNNSDIVQSIICVTHMDEGLKSLFLNELNGVSIVQLKEKRINCVRAEKLMKSLVRKDGFTYRKEAMGEITSNEEIYTELDVLKQYYKWSRKMIKEQAYPQYLTDDVVYSEQKKKVYGDAMDKLQKMIGLSQAKEVLSQALDYYKLQKIYERKGMKTNRVSMHMVFTGNPGTAKTTAARIFAKVLEENKIIENSEVYEVGRADIVGEYVGSTAPKVKKVFSKAKGGLLFIDEAYSLLDDKKGLYGDEAINTIVQEMENHRDDVIVIFAGYPDEMQHFLERNPGLQSRIAFHVPFEDYSVEELCEITKYMAEEKEILLDLDVKEKLENIYTKAAKNSDFGNGRFVRNMIEKARMRQASRIVNLNIEEMTDEDLKTLKAVDFEYEVTKKNEQRTMIGF